MSSHKLTQKKTIQVLQQEIRSLIQNFDWETNPTWIQKWISINNQIKIYWKDYKNV